MFENICFAHPQQPQTSAAGIAHTHGTEHYAIAKAKANANARIRMCEEFCSIVSVSNRKNEEDAANNGDDDAGNDNTKGSKSFIPAIISKRHSNRNRSAFTFLGGALSFDLLRKSFWLLYVLIRSGYETLFFLCAVVVLELENVKSAVRKMAKCALRCYEEHPLIHNTTSDTRKLKHKKEN